MWVGRFGTLYSYILTKDTFEALSGSSLAILKQIQVGSSALNDTTFTNFTLCGGLEKRVIFYTDMNP